jgi:hypothetical protein
MTIVSNSIVLDFTTKGKDMRGYCSIDELAQKLSREFNGAVNNFVTLRTPEQAYFWSKEWQEAEAEATVDIRKGRVIKFSNAKDAIRYLKSRQT